MRFNFFHPGVLKFLFWISLLGCSHTGNNETHPNDNIATESSTDSVLNIKPLYNPNFNADEIAISCFCFGDPVETKNANGTISVKMYICTTPTNVDLKSLTKGDKWRILGKETSNRIAKMFNAYNIIESCDSRKITDNRLAIILGTDTLSYRNDSTFFANDQHYLNYDFNVIDSIESIIDTAIACD